MKTLKILAALSCFVLAFPAVAQHTITFHGDTVIGVRIEEDNSYCDRSGPYTFYPEMVYPPEAWIEYMAWNGKLQILLKRNAQRTKTTEMNSTTWLHLDSLMAEIGINRLVTAADLGITEKMFNKIARGRATYEEFNKWLAKKYEEYEDENIYTILTDAFGIIRIEIMLQGGTKKIVSLWKDHPDMPIDFGKRQFFNLHFYRHLCALMPETFDFSYEDFLRRLIIYYYDLGQFEH